MTDRIIGVDNISKEYGDITAVSELSFSVKKGEFLSLLGPSGCGKTTTLRMIAGFDTPTAGSITIAGQSMENTPAYDRDVGMVFQGYALFPHKTVGENVGYGLRMEGVPKEERNRRIEDILKLVDLGGFEDRSPSELSGGQQQRVALSRALVTEPSVLLLDEPLANLDLKLRKSMRFELKKIQNELGITTVYVTHDQEEALSLSDRIIVMNEGHSEQIGSPREIYHHPKNEFVADFIGEANILNGSAVEVNQNNIKVSLDIDPDQVIIVARSNAPDSIREGDPVSVNIRPEKFSVTQGPKEPNSLTGTINTLTFLGRSTRFLFDSNGSELLVESTGTRDHSELQPGDEISVSWHPEDVQIFIGGGER